MSEIKQKKRCGRPRLPESYRYFQSSLPARIYDTLALEADRQNVTIRDLFRKIAGDYCERLIRKSNRPETETPNKKG